MAVNVKTGSVGFPWPLGKVLPGAAFATASVALTQNTLPVANDGVTPDKMFNGIYIQAHPDNAGNIYVCSSAAAPDLVNYANVLGILLPGQWYPREKQWANNRDITQLFIGAANAADFVIVSIDQF